MGKKGKKGKGKKDKKAAAAPGGPGILGQLFTPDDVAAAALELKAREAVTQCAQLRAENKALRVKLRTTIQDHEDVYESLSSKVERNRTYIQTLLDQQEALEREKDEIEDRLTSQLQVQKNVTRDAKLQMQRVELEWSQKEDLINKAQEVMERNAELTKEVEELAKQVAAARAQLEVRRQQAAVMAKATEGVEGIVPLTVEAMRRFPTIVQMQREACAALQNICTRANAVQGVGGTVH